MTKVKLPGMVRYVPEGVANARLVQEVVGATKPKLVLHGHWQQVRLPEQEVQVIGLSMDGTDQSWMVLDLPRLGITREPARRPDPSPFSDLPVVEFEPGLTGYRLSDIERTLTPDWLADFARWFRGRTGMIPPTKGPLTYRHDCERRKRWRAGH
ncbi:MAG: hypothetical protein ACYCYK_14320 [Candidatus Dormibacteria bacterium]